MDKSRLEIPGLVALTPETLLEVNGGRGRRAARESVRSLPAAPTKPSGLLATLLRPFR